MSYINLPLTGASPFWGNAVSTAASLPTTGLVTGEIVLTLDTAALYYWDGAAWVVFLDGPADVSGPASSTDNAVTRFDGVTGKVIQNSTATLSDAGVVTASGFVGPLTGNVTGNLTGNVTGNVDSVSTGGTDTLNLGTGNADIINIGHSGVTVNIQGTTEYQDVTNLQVTDKNITLNKGGSAGSATSAGIELEEGGSTTGYCQTSSDRNSWTLKAPNTAGVATLTAGASGITLDQSSHNPVTIGTGNGLSLATQALSLAAAATGTTGALTSTDWNTFNGKVTGAGTVTDNAVVRFDATTGKLVQNSGVIIDDSNNTLLSGAAGTTVDSPTLTLRGYNDAGVAKTLTFQISGGGPGYARITGPGGSSLTQYDNGLVELMCAGPAAKIGVNGSMYSNDGSNTLIPLNNSFSALVCRGLSSQSANLQEWQNNSETVLATVSSAGAMAAPTGKFGALGAITTSAALEVSSTTGALLMPRMTTTQRDALTGTAGMCVFNTTTNRFEGYIATDGWVQLHGWGS